MAALNKDKTQLIVVLGIFAVWAFSMLLVVWDGSTLAKLVTPVMTMMLGWLFAERATGA